MARDGRDLDEVVSRYLSCGRKVIGSILHIASFVLSVSSWWMGVVVPWRERKKEREGEKGNVWGFNSRGNFVRNKGERR